MSGLADLWREVDQLAAGTTFSGVVRVDAGGQPPRARAYGWANRAAGVRTATETRFAIASGGKTFTALAVIALIEARRLQLTSAARDLLGPDLPLLDDGVTVEHLLVHRSGIGDYLDEDVDVNQYALAVPAQRLVETEDYLPILDGHPQQFPPGQRFAYCNAGYVVLALIAERASGTPFHRLVADRVCEPVGLHDTAFLRSDELPGGAAVGYLEAEGLRTNVFHLPARGSGDGGIFSTVTDIHQLWAAMLAGRVVSPDWVARMTEPRSHTPSGRMGYGLGFWIDTLRGTVVMEGSDAGVSFRSVHAPATGTTFTVVSNTSKGAWPLVRHLDDLLNRT